MEMSDLERRKMKLKKNKNRNTPQTELTEAASSKLQIEEIQKQLINTRYAITKGG